MPMECCAICREVGESEFCLQRFLFVLLCVCFFNWGEVYARNDGIRFLFLVFFFVFLALSLTGLT